MKWFGRKSAGRADARPVLARGWGSWASAERPWCYDREVRAGYVANPVVQRAVRLVAEGVGAAPLAGAVPEAVALVQSRTAGQALLETVAMQVLLHGNGFVRVMGGGSPLRDPHLARPQASHPLPEGEDFVSPPTDLFALRPERVTVERDALGWPVAYLRHSESAQRGNGRRYGGACRHRNDCGQDARIRDYRGLRNFRGTLSYNARFAGNLSWVRASRRLRHLGNTARKTAACTASKAELVSCRCSTRNT